MVSGNRLVNTRPHSRKRRREKTLALLAICTDDKGLGVIANPTIDNRTRIDRDDIAIFEDDIGARNAVDHHVIHRGADGGGKAAISFERRGSACFGDAPLGGRVELGRAHAWPYKRTDHLERLCTQVAGCLHCINLGRRFNLDAIAAKALHGSYLPIAVLRFSKTISGDCPPSSSMRIPLPR